MKSELPVLLKSVEEQYIKETDWEVQENANVSKSFANFIGYYIDKTWKHPSIISEIFGEQACKEYYDRSIHIHKMPFSFFIPYCTGWSFEKILRKGLVTPTIISKPAKHLDTACSHLSNFFYIATQEWTGAMATSAFDLYTAPFVNSDKLSFKEIKQVMQEFVFNLNYPSRLGYQCPFTNITIVLDTVETYLDSDAIIAGKPAGRLGDYIDEAITVTRALTEVYLEGDAKGQPFTFPIPTLFLTKNFDWNNTKWDGLSDYIFEALAKRGTFYLLNGFSTNVDCLLSMCCRLNIDMQKAYMFSIGIQEASGPRGVWAIPDATGSIGVVTINLPRLAIEAKGEEQKFFELLEEKLKLAREVLMRMRRRYERSLRSGMMPITKEYIAHLNSHYNTFGLVGLPEAAANLIDPDLWIKRDREEINKAVKLMKRIVSFVRRFSEECEKQDNVLYNVEEVPAESTALWLAQEDYRRYKELVENRDVFIPVLDGVPIYSNSIIPYYIDVPLYDRARWEGEVQQEFTGGVMMHIFLFESPDPSALRRLVEKIAKNTKVVYFSITPTIASCRHCGWNAVGIYTKCPKCGRKVELWSRIVGYYRPISKWNIGKRAEFFYRVHYGESGSIMPKYYAN